MLVWGPAWKHLAADKKSATILRMGFGRNPVAFSGGGAGLTSRFVSWEEAVAEISCTEGEEGSACKTQKDLILPGSTRVEPGPDLSGLTSEQVDASLYPAPDSDREK